MSIVSTKAIQSPGPRPKPQRKEKEGVAVDRDTEGQLTCPCSAHLAPGPWMDQGPKMDKLGPCH